MLQDCSCLYQNQRRKVQPYEIEQHDEEQQTYDEVKTEQQEQPQHVTPQPQKPPKDSSFKKKKEEGHL